VTLSNLRLLHVSFRCRPIPAFFIIRTGRRGELASRRIRLIMRKLRTHFRFPFPTPIHKSQPLSVGFFLCGALRKYGGSCGCLRTPPLSPVTRSRPNFTLSWPFFSPPRQRQNFEVRKHQNFARYDSIAYSRTSQAVGWRHCLPGGNHHPGAAVRRRSFGAVARAYSIYLIMPFPKSRTCPWCPESTVSIATTFSYIDVSPDRTLVDHRFQANTISFRAALSPGRLQHHGTPCGYARRCCTAGGGPRGSGQASRARPRPARAPVSAVAGRWGPPL
jgi:hypothetical protein